MAGAKTVKATRSVTFAMMNETPLLPEEETLGDKCHYLLVLYKKRPYDVAFWVSR